MLFPLTVRSKYIEINFFGAINIETNKCEEIVSFVQVLLGQIVREAWALPNRWYQI